MFLMVNYIALLVFYTKLTNLAQKFKILDYMKHEVQN